MRADASLADLERQLRSTLAGVLQPAVDSERASIDYDISGYGDHFVTPTSEDALPFGVILQDASEISLFPTHPASGRTVTVDLWSSDPDELFAYFEAYLRAIVAGRVQLAIDLTGRGGRFRVWLDDGHDPITHLYNVMFGFRAGKGKRLGHVGSGFLLTLL